MVGTSNFTLYTSHSAEGRSCETKPISTTMPIRRSAFPGAILRNKPNLRGAGAATKYRSEQGLGEKCAESSREETKPIWPGGAGRRKKSGGTPTRSLSLRAGSTKSRGCDRACKTKPIRIEIEAQGSGVSDLAPDAGPLSAGLSCETNPICFGSDTSQVPCGTAVTSDSAPGGLQKTNPNNAAPRGTVIPSASFSGQALPVNPEHGQDAHATHGRDGRATGTPNAVIRVWEPTHGRDAHATVPPGGGTMDGVEDQGQSCETNPIGRGRKWAITIVPARS